MTDKPRTNAQVTRARHQAAFLEAFANCGLVTVACAASGVARRTIYDWKQNDEFFAKAFDEASESAHELLVQEARRRARDGYDEYVVSGGRLILNEDGTPRLQRRYSDQLLKFLIELRSGQPIQRIEHGGEIKGTDVKPAFIAEVLRALDSSGVGDLGESQA